MARRYSAISGQSCTYQVLPSHDHAQRIIFNVRNIDASGLARNREIHTYLAYDMPLTIERDGRQETPTVRFFDFDHPEPGVGLNAYVVTTQFRVRRAMLGPVLGGQVTCGNPEG